MEAREEDEEEREGDDPRMGSGPHLSQPATPNVGEQNTLVTRMKKNIGK